jgi:hypothetical protein
MNRRFALCIAIGTLGSLSRASLPAGEADQASTKENLDLPYDAEVQIVDDGGIPEVVTFYGTRLEGDGFFYVIDRSGTMQQGELPRAKQEVVSNLQEFSDSVEFGVIFFDKSVLKFPQNGQPARATQPMKAAAITFVRSVAGGGGTCGQAGLSAALDMANQSSVQRKVIVYLSDGGGTCPGFDECTYLRQTLANITSKNWQRIPINTIAVLSLEKCGEEFLRGLATANGGTYTRIAQ